jgi:hypothetical protein
VVRLLRTFALQQLGEKEMYLRRIIFLLAVIWSTPHVVFADAKTLSDVTISFLAVNGGQDTLNPGTTCFKLSGPVSATCAGGYVGIPNNNEQLVSTALTARASGSKLWVYYEDSASNLHCPGLQFTPCSAISIAIK